jgi:hypothetical protein
VNNPLDVKENDENAFDCSSFGLGEFGLSMYGSCFLPQTLV